MPKVLFTNTKGLHQLTGTGEVALSGEGVLFGNLHSTTQPAAVTALKAADSGKTFLLDGTDCVITLPELSSSLIGVEYRFICQAGDNDAYVIKTGDIADSGGDDFIGALVGTAAAAADGGANANGRFVAAAANDSQISIDLNLSNNKCTQGTIITCTAVSATEWFIRGYVSVATATSNLSAIFSNAS